MKSERTVQALKFAKRTQQDILLGRKVTESILSQALTGQVTIEANQYRRAARVLRESGYEKMNAANIGMTIRIYVIRKESGIEQIYAQYRKIYMTAVVKNEPYTDRIHAVFNTLVRMEEMYGQNTFATVRNTPRNAYK